MVSSTCASITGPSIASTAARTGKRWCCCSAAATSEPRHETLELPMTTGKTTKPAAASRPFNAGTYLRDEADVAAYLEAVLEDGDARVVPVALRTVRSEEHTSELQSLLRISYAVFCLQKKH